MKMMIHALLVLTLFVSASCTNQEEGQYIPGVNGPYLNVQDGKLLLSVELENIDLQAGVTLPVPKLKNSSVTVGPAMGEDGTIGGTMIRVLFDLKDVENDNFKVVPSQTLPDGRPFPFMINGTLPALALHVPKAKNATFYVSEKVFGFFLPIKIPKDFNVDVHYRIKINGKSYGIVSLIHADEAGEGSGLVALLTLEEIRKNPDAQKLMKLSKRYKSVVF
ncbi:MAG: hypothetical protein VYA54_09910 [Bdellovibrionota bacterium]|nr:hypothetical protein [Bdellovibrionota bacterium]